MALSRRHVMGQKHVFRKKGYEILIFQYHSKNKYCADVAFTSTYKFLCKPLNLLQSYCPRKISTMRRSRRLQVVFERRIIIYSLFLVLFVHKIFFLSLSIQL